MNWSKFLILMTFASPTWASENLSDSWDVLKAQSELGVGYVARSPVSMYFELDTGINTAMTIYVFSPTIKYNYCSVSLIVAAGDEEVLFSKHHELTAKWIGKKETTSSYSLSADMSQNMIKNPSRFITNLKAYDEVELTYPLASGLAAKNRVSLKGSSKAISKACSVSPLKPTRSATTSSRFSVKERISAEMDRTIETRSFCGSTLYYRVVGNSLYVGIRGIRRDQEILEPASSPHWQLARTALNTPPFDSQIRSGNPFWLNVLCPD